MKAMFILFLIALAISASNPQSYPTYSIKAGMLGVSDRGAKAGVVREDTMIPDMNIVDGYRLTGYPTEVVNARDKEQHEFVLGQQ